MPPAPEDHTTILKVQVGSHAHGLAQPSSDVDSRRVFVIPTETMFRVDYRPSASHWTRTEEDETAWEVGRFLFLATRCHPLILETFLAPVLATDPWGQELRALFPAVWSAQPAFESFLAYAANQRKKFLDKKDGRPAKYAATYLRVLHNLCELLEKESFTVRIIDTDAGEIIGKVKRGEVRSGKVIDLAEDWIERATRSLADCRHQADLPKVNDYLIRLRKAFL
jgi:predicted nucleotidyltransferase